MRHPGPARIASSRNFGRLVRSDPRSVSPASVKRSTSSRAGSADGAAEVRRDETPRCARTRPGPAALLAVDRWRDAATTAGDAAGDELLDGEVCDAVAVMIAALFALAYRTCAFAGLVSARPAPTWRLLGRPSMRATFAGRFAAHVCESRSRVRPPGGRPGGVGRGGCEPPPRLHGSRRRRQPGARLRPGPRRRRGGDRPHAARLRRQGGEVEARITLRVRRRRRRRPRPPRPVARARNGAPTRRALDGAADFVGAYRGPASSRRSPATEGPRHLDHDFEMVQDTFRRFAEDKLRPVAEHIHRTNADIPEDDHRGLAEIGGFGLSVPEEYGGLRGRRRVRLPRHGRRHRGAVARLARRRRLAHHPPRDPHPRAGAGGTEEQKQRVAPELASGGGDGGGRRHRARLRLRRRRRQGHGDHAERRRLARSTASRRGARSAPAPTC